MKKEVLELKQGNITLSIPILRIGRGKPQTLIISGLHGDGDEATGLLVIKEFLSRIKQEKIEGSLTVIPTANPFGRILNYHEDPLSGQDLNRIVGKEIKSSLTKKLIEKLLRICQDHDLVIDIHTMMLHAPIIAIFMNAGSKAVKKASQKAILKFAPEIIWRLSPGTEREIEYSGSLGPNLALEGIANFAIEMPKPETLTQKQLSKTVVGLLRILENEQTPKEHPIEIERTLIRANRSGLFIPKVGVTQNFKRDQLLGRLILSDLEEMEVRAPFKGMLVSHIGKSQVKEGDELLSIGR